MQLLAQQTCRENRKHEVAKHHRIDHYHTDLAGLPLEITDEDGNLRWAGKYSAWGKFERKENIKDLHEPEQNLRYAGQYEDTATGLHYNTFRYYDPDIGRYISQDPIGLAGGITFMGMCLILVGGLIRLG
jgi:RHS repeat-associated protein